MCANSQTYTTNQLNVRTADGWDVYEKVIEVIFVKNKQEDTITITTDGNSKLYYVTSKMLFVKSNSFIYTIEDEKHEKSSLRIVTNDLNELDFYFYSDRLKEKYFKLKLIKI